MKCNHKNHKEDPVLYHFIKVLLSKKGRKMIETFVKNYKMMGAVGGKGGK